MANPNAPFGLRPVRHITGAPYDGQTVKCYVSSAYATALYVGDPVLFSATLAEKDPTGRYPTVNASAGTTGTLVRGVIVSVEPNPNDLTKTYIPASTGGYVNVCMDPDIVFQIRDDGSGTPSKVFPGQNAEMANAGGSTTTGLSGYQLDASTPTTTQAFTLHILGLADLPDNILDDYAVWEVLLNTPENATGRFLGITAS